MSAEQFLKGIISGGKAREQGLKGLFDLYAGRLKSYFRRYGCSDEDAADLLQETFVRVLRSAGQFRQDAQVSTWIWSIARNCLNDRWRSRENNLSLETLKEEEGDAFETLFGAVGPEHELNEMRSCVRKVFLDFAQKHPESAQAIQLAAVEGWTMEELGAFLGRTANATKEFVSQCKKRLKPFLARCRELLPA